MRSLPLDKVGHSDYNVNMNSKNMQQWLQELVKQLETTQAGLAKKVGRSHTSIYRWVSGEIVPDPESCRRLARVAGVSEDYVLKLAGHRTIGEEPTPPRLAYVIERVQTMPPAMQEVVTDAIIEVVEAFSRLRAKSAEEEINTSGQETTSSAPPALEKRVSSVPLPVGYGSLDEMPADKRTALERDIEALRAKYKRASAQE